MNIFPVFCPLLYDGISGIHGYETEFLVMKRNSWLWNSIHGYETEFMVMKQYSWLWNGIHGYETVFMVMKRNSWSWNGIHGYETVFMVMKRNSWLWNGIYCTKLLFSLAVVPTVKSIANYVVTWTCRLISDWEHLSGPWSQSMLIGFFSWAYL